MLDVISAAPQSLDEWLQNPPERTEWVDGALLEKDEMTLKHSRVQLKLGRFWDAYAESSGQGGIVYTEAPCRTNTQGRSPDVAYLTPELVDQYGNETILPQSFPLIAEIVSPTDRAEEIFAKATEYLSSGSQEVWLVLPESQWIVILTEQGRSLFSAGELAKTRILLPGFMIELNKLFG
jgi:Uma2 family endonuclease